jgi:MFS family permease
MITLLGRIGYKWTLIVGAGCWLLMYLIYIRTKPRWLIVCSQSLHGLAYVFFIIVGQIFVKTVAPKEILSSMQGLIFAATMGIGLFFGTQFAGIVMDKHRKEEKFQWRQIFIVPAGIAFVCILILVLFFKS